MRLMTDVDAAADAADVDDVGGVGVGVGVCCIAAVDVNAVTSAITLRSLLEKGRSLDEVGKTIKEGGRGGGRGSHVLGDE